eukprot:11737759-Ditylum_brightwellii.AAC.1
MTVKEWVSQVHPLDKDKIMDILEYGVLVAWHREFTMQGFDPVDQVLKKIVEFCTRLELCKPSADKLKDENSSKSKNARKCKADTHTKPTSEKKFYCDLHRHNKTHDTDDCYKLKQRTKRAKHGKERKDMDK